MTKRTASVRPEVRSVQGPGTGFERSAIFFLARVSRAAIADSFTKNALATSVVLSPQSMRNASATRVSMRDSVTAREDKTEPVVLKVTFKDFQTDRRVVEDEKALRANRHVAATPDVYGTASRDRREPRAGILGMPCSPQDASARANASCTHSSRTSKSWVIRIVAAITNAHSCR